jgi:scyllo-inositol 2-dehydrogenase (NADP+)
MINRSNKKINTVILGYGFSGSIFFAPFIDLHPGFKFTGALERSKKKIENDFPGARSYDTLEQVLMDKEVDLVVVNTPINTHYELAKQVLAANKNVIVEKTFTSNAPQAMELYNLADEKELHLFVFQNRRYDSDFRTVEKVLRQGKLGTIVEATLSYDFYIPEVRGDVHTEHPLSGGEFYNRGSHIADQAIKLFGLPTAVFADFAAFRHYDLS